MKPNDPRAIFARAQREANKACLWHFDEGWVFAASFLDPGLRQSPDLTLWQARWDKNKEEYDYSKCTERLTLWDAGFQEKLRELVIAEAKKRDA